ncbi:MAG: hypothetical protein RL385_3232, partial [Pseudomonadota bacterium]
HAGQLGAHQGDEGRVGRSSPRQKAWQGQGVHLLSSSQGRRWMKESESALGIGARVHAAQRTAGGIGHAQAVTTGRNSDAARGRLRGKQAGPAVLFPDAESGPRSEVHREPAAHACVAAAPVVVMVTCAMHAVRPVCNTDIGAQDLQGCHAFCHIARGRPLEVVASQRTVPQKRVGAAAASSVDTLQESLALERAAERGLAEALHCTGERTPTACAQIRAAWRRRQSSGPMPVAGEQQERGKKPKKRHGWSSPQGRAMMNTQPALSFKSTAHPRTRPCDAARPQRNLRARCTTMREKTLRGSARLASQMRASVSWGST